MKLLATTKISFIKKKNLTLLLLLMLQIICFGQNSKLFITAKANAGTSNQANNDFSVTNGSRTLNLSSSTISCTSRSSNNQQIYKVTVEDDYDNNGRVDKVTFDLVVAAHKNSTYNFSDRANASSMTKLGGASKVSIAKNVWGVDGDGDVDAGETVVFTVRNLSVSNLSARYQPSFDGFNILGLFETNGGNNHRIIKGTGRNLKSYVINFSKETAVENEASITLTGAGSGTTNEIREWGMSLIKFSITIKDKNSNGFNDLSDYSLFSNASNFGKTYPKQKKKVNSSEFCWNKVPRWLALRNTQPLTNAEVNDIASHYQIVLLEKANNQGLSTVDGGMVSLATRLKAKNPKITTLFYWNTWINYGGYSANNAYRPNQWSDLGSNGRPKLFKNLYFTYNFNVKPLRDWWIKTAVDAMQYDVLDGVFIDKVVYGAFKDVFPNGNPANNYVRMLEDLYDAMPRGKKLIGNIIRTERTNSNRGLMEVADGSYMERWAFPGTALDEAEATAISIQAMREALSKGKEIHFQTSPNDTGGDKEPNDFAGKVKYAKDNVKYPLAVYLIFAEKGAYFSYQVSVNARASANEAWNTSFIDEFNYKLGAPLGPPTKDGFIYTRSYENVDVWVDLTTKKARLNWKDKTKIKTAECLISNSCDGFDAFSTIEAEDYCDERGIKTEPSSEGGQNVGFINNGDWIKFDDVDFDKGASSVNVRIAGRSASGTIQFRLGSTTGPIIGTLSTPVTGGWQNWKTVSTKINGASGVKDLFLVFPRGGFNVNWIKFTKSVTPKDGQIVHITKRNAPRFAIDGGNGSKNGQNTYLWPSNSSNKNQQWNEIDRGNGYYSYKKVGTNSCIDGGRGGANGQNVYLWTCNDRNQNQQWEKVNVGSGSFKLIKRNASGFAIDGGNGGANRQNIGLNNASNSSQNLHWRITPVKTVNKVINQKDTTQITENFEFYPNPVKDVLNIEFKGTETARVSILNLTGQIVYSGVIKSGTNAIRLETLDVGLYILKIVDDTQVHTQKIMLEK